MNKRHFVTALAAALAAAAGTALAAPPDSRVPARSMPTVPMQGPPTTAPVTQPSCIAGFSPQNVKPVQNSAGSGYTWDCVSQAPLSCGPSRSATGSGPSNVAPAPRVQSGMNAGQYTGGPFKYSCDTAPAPVPK